MTMDTERHKHVLPRGFHYLEADAVFKKNRILSAFIESSKNMFEELVEFPPVAYWDDFMKASHIMGDKVFEFKDKKNRHLVLTPDALVHVYNHYLQKNTGRNVRYSWISPTFRYRHAPVRHFYQIGYSSINFSPGRDMSELMACVIQLRNFVHETTLKEISLRIVNPALISEIINSRTSDEGAAAELLAEVRLKKESITLGDTLSDINLKEDLLELYSASERNPVRSKRLIRYNGYEKALEFYEAISKEAHISCNLELLNPYSAEILSGVGFIIEIEGKKIGDGGIYSSYGSTYNKKITGVASVCTGINALSRQIVDQ